MIELNNIYLGDSYELIKKIPDKSVDLVIIDPPYFIGNTDGGQNNGLGKSIANMNNQLRDNNLTDGIDNSLLNDLMRVMKVPNIYIWCNHKQIPQYLDFFVKDYGCNFDILIWKKTNAVPLFYNKYLTDKEYCLYFRKGGYCNPKDYESAKTVWEYPINMSDKKLYDHPTIKPLHMIKTLIENSSQEGDVVLDTFLGSGTTAVACKELGRNYIGFEINEEYYKIAQDRLNGISQVERREKEAGVMNIFDFIEE